MACLPDFGCHAATDVQWCTGVLGTDVERFVIRGQQIVGRHGGVIAADVVLDVNFGLLDPTAWLEVSKSRIVTIIVVCII